MIKDWAVQFLCMFATVASVANAYDQDIFLWKCDQDESKCNSYVESSLGKKYSVNSERINIGYKTFSQEWIKVRDVYHNKEVRIFSGKTATDGFRVEINYMGKIYDCNYYAIFSRETKLKKGIHLAHGFPYYGGVFEYRESSEGDGDIVSAISGHGPYFVYRVRSYTSPPLEHLFNNFQMAWVLSEIGCPGSFQ